ncbi:AMP-binding protein, partial [Thioclava sp. BHET1]
MILSRSSCSSEPGPIWPVFASHVERAPEALALVSASSRMSYGALAQAAEHVATHLMCNGIGPGDHVGLFESRSVAAIIAMLGILRAGAVFVPLDPSHAPEQLGFIARDLDLSGVLVADRYAQAAAETLPSDMRRFRLEEALQARSHADGRDWPQMSGEDAAYVMYTSGTTGAPKGVVTPQRAITAFVR